MNHSSSQLSLPMLVSRALRGEIPAVRELSSLLGQKNRQAVLSIKQLLSSHKDDLWAHYLTAIRVLRAGKTEDDPQPKDLLNRLIQNPQSSTKLKAYAQAELGVLGLDAHQEEAALSLLDQAVEEGCLEAIAYKANWLSRQGHEQESLALLLKGSDRGDIRCQYHAGRQLVFSITNPSQTERGLELLFRAAHAGCLRACYDLIDFWVKYPQWTDTYDIQEVVAAMKRRELLDPTVSFQLGYYDLHRSIRGPVLDYQVMYEGLERLELLFDQNPLEVSKCMVSFCNDLLCAGFWSTSLLEAKLYLNATSFLFHYAMQEGDKEAAGMLGVLYARICFCFSGIEDFQNGQAYRELALICLKAYNESYKGGVAALFLGRLFYPMYLGYKNLKNHPERTAYYYRQFYDKNMKLSGMSWVEEFIREHAENEAVFYHVIHAVNPLLVDQALEQKAKAFKSSKKTFDSIYLEWRHVVGDEVCATLKGKISLEVLIERMVLDDLLSVEVKRKRLLKIQSCGVKDLGECLVTKKLQVECLNEMRKIFDVPEAP